MRLVKTNKTYPHIYPTIISKELFDTCRNIRLGRKGKSFKWAGKDYVFRGLIECGNTGRIVPPIPNAKLIVTVAPRLRLICVLGMGIKQYL